MYVRGKVKAPHFKHSPTDENKDCEERSRSPYDWTRSNKLPSQFISPLILCVGQNNFHFEREGERLSLESVIRDQNVDGALFKIGSGRMLPPDSDVRLDKKYYLFASKKLLKIPVDVECNLVAQKNIRYKTWYVFEVKAVALTKETATFFLRYHYRLTDNPIALRIIFPIVTVEPHFIHHSAQTMFVTVTGNAHKIGFFPKTQPPRQLNGTDINLVKVDRVADKQLIIAGRAQPLKYLNLERGLPPVGIETPKVEVTDVMGDPIADGVSNVLPRDRILFVRTDFDGCVIIDKRGVLTNKIFIKADESITVDGIEFGLEIKIFQGLDCIRTIRYESAAKNFSASDEELYRRLERGGGRPIAISHTWGGLADVLKDYPKVRSWLYRRIRAGFAPEESYKIFRWWVLNKGADVVDGK